MLTEGISEICGAIIGDGWIQSNESGLFITGNITKDKSYYDDHLVPLIRKELKINIRARQFPYWRICGVSICQPDIIKMFLRLGMLKGKKALGVFIPNIFKKDKKYFIPLLRGIFDTDGSIYFMKDPNPSRKTNFHIRSRIVIVSISKRLIDEIKILTKRIGINHANPGPSHYKTNVHPAYKFEINRRDSIKQWLSLIGTKNLVHQTKIDLWKKFGFVPPNTTLEQRIKTLKGLIKSESYYTVQGYPSWSKGWRSS